MSDAATETSTSDGSARAAALAWLADDPDPDTRAELEALLDGDETALAERFGGRLQFGTAGLRGELGAGPLRMNRVIVRRTAAGLASYLLTTVPDAAAASSWASTPGARAMCSPRTPPAVLAGVGVTAYLLPRPLPTPVPRWRSRSGRAAPA